MHLNDSVTTLPFISSSYQHRLVNLGIETVQDLVTYFPRSYVDSSNSQTIREIILDDSFIDKTVQIQAKVDSFKGVYTRSRKTLQTAVMSDATGSIKCMWFNQPFLKNAFKEGNEFMLVGKLKKKGTQFTLFPSVYEKIVHDRELVHTGRIAPKYKLTSGISEKWFRNRIKYVVDNIDIHEMPLELSNLNISQEVIAQSLYMLHFPEDFEKLENAIQVLSLVELVHIQLKLEAQREKSRKYKAIAIKNDKLKIKNFVDQLPYELTKDQVEVTNQLQEMMYKNELINALIQGDVGSGKTIVGVILALAVVLSGHQVVFLAPTTILAKQQYDSFKTLLKDFDISIDLAIGSKKDTQKSDILIGTTAVLARKQNLIENVGLIIVDEQHRFGVKQREELLAPFVNLEKQKFYPHFINMTATPIPRTIAQTLFGDVEVFTIKTKPKNRKHIKTFIVPDQKRSDSYAWIEEAIENEDGQVFWVCPLVEESEVIQAKSAEEVYKELRTAMPEHKIALLHGRMKPNEKTEIMKDFKEKKYEILVATSVIEVGIDVPNATIMVIENADRFGLAQLHQIRGRVGRGDKQSYCFLFTSNDLKPEKRERIEFFASHTDGLEIAQYDLEHRGPGEVYGTAQTGVPNLKIAQLNNLEALKTSRKVAQMLYNKGVRKIELFS